MEALEALLATAQDQFTQQLVCHFARLAVCERSVRKAAQQQAQQAAQWQQRQQQWQQESDELHAHIRKLQIQLQHEKQERYEEKEWVTQLWPDNAVLPTLLQPFKASLELVKDLPDDAHRNRLFALVERRAMRDRVRMQIEATSYWEMVVTVADGQEQRYYVNTHTNETSWDAPAAMFYEPPSGWDSVKMDWKASYGIEHFYSEGYCPEDEENDGSADPAEAVALESKQKGSKEGTDDADDTNEDEDRDEAEEAQPDSTELRDLISQEFERCKRLEVDLESSRSAQRVLALKVLNATRDAFEREKEELEQRDSEVKAAERKKRKALLQEQAAAKAKAEAEERRRNNSVQPKFARDSVGKKDLTNVKDDELFEKELEEFALAQRADSLYLTMPIANDERVKFHKQTDDEFAHMKHIEEQVQQIEQLEFDLLEKSALRIEEATAKCDELRDLCEQIRSQQAEMEMEIPPLQMSIMRLQVPLPPPATERPSAEGLQQAHDRGVTPRSLVLGEIHESDEEQQQDAEESILSPEERVAMRTEVEIERMSKTEVNSILQEEEELERLKHIVHAEKQWRDWEKEEVMRLDELKEACDRLATIQNSLKHFTVDLALFESDQEFFKRVGELEQDLNKRLWTIQADSQVERVRFMIERALREVSLYQMNERLEELQLEFDQVQTLHLQAMNPLERLQLIEESRERSQAIQSSIDALGKRYEREHEAKSVLMELELRSSRYAMGKLEEEMKLFKEKQTLWELNTTLGEELVATRQTIERLYLLMEQQEQPNEESDGVPTLKLYDEANEVFESKLQYIQQMRQFFFLCYDREARWRSLASISLIKDCATEQWMTEMQTERHEAMLSLLQEQHEGQMLELRKQIKVQDRVKRLLQTEIEELKAKVDRIQNDYQASSDFVLQETQQVILVLKQSVVEQEHALKVEKTRAREEVERLIEEYSALREDLEARLLQHESINDKQRHWLTAAKRELHAQRVANEELLKSYQSLEKRRATETNDMRFRIASQIKRISNIEMWNLSLKLKAKEANVERVQMQNLMKKQMSEHKQQQRHFRLQNWKHRVTAQAILTNVDSLFAFFADGLAILCGSSAESNAELRGNGGIEVLAALARHNVRQKQIQIICAKALGQLVWNANTTPRSLGWQAKRKWFEWMTRRSGRVLKLLAEQNLAFDAVVNEASTAMNWLADPSELGVGGVGESDLGAVARDSKKIAFVRSWRHQLDTVAHPDVNKANQEYIGLAPSVLKTIIDLCRPQVHPIEDADDGDDIRKQYKQIQRNALLSLALIVMNTRNTTIVGHLDGAIPLLVDLITPKDVAEDTQVLLNATHALDNLSFQNSYNQQLICAQPNSISSLLQYCEEHGDVDLIFASLQTLVHLTADDTKICEVVFDAGGINILTRLCHSARIYDAIDLDIFERIQTRAAEAISNIITLLDTEDKGHGASQRSVANAIMDEEVSAAGSRISNNRPPKQEIRGVATFVLMCASCNRDVALHGAMVLGSIAQHDEIRMAIGNAGGIDALFLLVDRPMGYEVTVQATWALANLTWNRDNQYRMARYLDQLYDLCTLTSPLNGSRSSNQSQEEGDGSSNQQEMLEAQWTEQIVEISFCIIANSLFYNDANRQLLASQSKWMQLLLQQCLGGQGHVLEHAARALCALSYSDSIALAMGTPLLNSKTALHAFVRLCGHDSNAIVQRHGIYGVINMCLHDVNKTKMLDIPGGIEMLVNLSGVTNTELCDPALEALDLLADVRQLKKDGIASSSALGAADLKKLIALLSQTSNPALIAMVSDAIADEAWRKPSSKVKLRNEHGLEKLLELCAGPMLALPQDEAAKVLVSCLWALRNTIADNVRNQDLVGALDGVERLVAVYDRHRQHEDVVEALLAVFVALVMKHPRNSQQLVQSGLDMLIALADQSQSSTDEDERQESFKRLSLLVPGKPRQVVLSPLKPSFNGKAQLENAALARELLHLVAPYNVLSVAESVVPSSPKRMAASPNKNHMRQKLQQMHATYLQQQPPSPAANRTKFSSN